MSSSGATTNTAQAEEPGKHPPTAKQTAALTGGPMPDLQALLDQIDGLDQEASDGPWAVWPQMDDEGETYPEYIEGPKNDLFGSRGEDGKHYIQEVPELTIRDAEFIALARTALPQLAKALRAVLELHTPQWSGDIPPGGYVCAACNIPVESEPCPTIQAITDAMEADDVA